MAGEGFEPSTCFKPAPGRRHRGKHANVSCRLVRESHLAPEIERLIALTRRSADDSGYETRVELLLTQGL